MTQEALGRASSQDPKQTARMVHEAMEPASRKFLITASEINGIKNCLS